MTHELNREMNAEYYRADLAYVHDAGFGAIARSAAQRLLDEMSECHLPHGHVVDLGCGSGILAAALSEAGYTVTGVDVSADMLALARARAPRAQFEVGSLLDYELPPCIAVAATGECVNYLFDVRNCAEELARLFARVYAALCRNGLFLFDFADETRRTCSSSHRFRVESDWATLVQVEDDPDPHLFVRHITTFRRHGDLYNRTEELHRQRLYSRFEIENALINAGFEVKILEGYLDERLPPGICCVLAEKKPSTVT